MEMRFVGIPVHRIPERDIHRGANRKIDDRSRTKDEFETIKHRGASRDEERGGDLLLPGSLDSPLFDRLCAKANDSIGENRFSFSTIEEIWTAEQFFDPAFSSVGSGGFRSSVLWLIIVFQTPWIHLGSWTFARCASTGSSVNRRIEWSTHFVVGKINFVRRKIEFRFDERLKTFDAVAIGNSTPFDLRSKRISSNPHVDWWRDEDFRRWTRRNTCRSIGSSDSGRRRREERFRVLNTEETISVGTRETSADRVRTTRHVRLDRRSIQRDLNEKPKGNEQFISYPVLV